MDFTKFSDRGGNEVLSSNILSLSKPITVKEGKELLRKTNALLRFHFKIDPEQLTDEEYSERWQELKFALHFESKRFNLKDGTNSLKL